MDVVLEKKNLRKQILEKVKLLSEKDRKKQSTSIFKKLVNHQIWKNSNSILLYASMPSEVDTWALIDKGLQENKTIGLPFYVKSCDIYEPRLIRELDKDIIEGNLGIKEPKELCPKMDIEDFDLIIVPGLAFSVDGYRLGRGKGYYDKILTRANGRKCGICFECQVVEKLPVEKHDVKMNCIITPSLLMEYL